MSSPTPDPKDPKSPATEFDLEAFWIQYRSKFLLGMCAIIVVLLSYAAYEWNRSKTLNGAEERLATAKTEEEFQKVVADYPKTNAAGCAMLLLAEQQRKSGKLEESTKSIRSFMDGYPEHPLFSGGLTSLATNLEAQGKSSEALAEYDKVSTSYGKTFSTPVALMASARLLRLGGSKEQKEKATQIYEKVIAEYPDNLASQQAAQEMKQLKKL